MEQTTLNAYLADNPRLIGVLFAATVLLAQAGSVIASPKAPSTAGP